MRSLALPEGGSNRENGNRWQEHHPASLRNLEYSRSSTSANGCTMTTCAYTWDLIPWLQACMKEDKFLIIQTQITGSPCIVINTRDLNICTRTTHVQYQRTHAHHTDSYHMIVLQTRKCTHNSHQCMHQCTHVCIHQRTHEFTHINVPTSYLLLAQPP